MTESVPCGTLGSAEARFWSKVDMRGPDECWPWTAYIDPSKGYGQFGRGRRVDGVVNSHRAAYEFTYGAVPPGMHVDHKCHNNSGCTGGKDCPHRKCCNPKHLEAVTQRENIARGMAGKWQNAKTQCPLGHDYTPENTFNNNGGRGCKKCRLLWNQKYNQKRKASA